MRPDRVLFYKQDLSAQLCHVAEVLKGAVDALDEQSIAGEIGAIAERLIREQGLAVPVLDLERATHDHDAVDVKRHAQPMALRAAPAVLKAVDFRFYIPFRGVRNFFHTRPSVCELNPPRAEVLDAEIVIHVLRTEQEQSQGAAGTVAAIRREFESIAARINANLDCLRRDMSGLESMLHEVVRTRVDMVRARRRTAARISDGLGIPRRMAS